MPRKIQPLRLTHHEFAQFYGEICDVFYREHAGIPDDDPFHHTSEVSRRFAMKLVDRLANEGYLEYR